MISFKCPKCGEPLSALDGFAEDMTDCPKCGGMVRIPSLAHHGRPARQTNRRQAVRPPKRRRAATTGGKGSDVSLSTVGFVLVLLGVILGAYIQFVSPPDHYYTSDARLVIVALYLICLVFGGILCFRGVVASRIEGTGCLGIALLVAFILALLVKFGVSRS